MSAVRIDRYPLAQFLFERLDGFFIGHEIIEIVQDAHFGIVAQPIHDPCEGARFEKTFRLRLGIAQLLLPQGHGDLRVIITQRESFGFFQPFSLIASRRRQNTLIVNHLGYVDQLVKLALQSHGEKISNLFVREIRKFPSPSGR